MREADPSLRGVRSSSLKAAIIKAQTGRDVAPRTIEHHERIARVVEESLEPVWRERAERGELSDAEGRPGAQGGPHCAKFAHRPHGARLQGRRPRPRGAHGDGAGG